MVQKAKKAKGERRKRHRLLAWVAAGAMALVVIAVIVAVVIMLRTPESSPPSAVPPGGLPPTSSPGTPHPHSPRPAYQDSSCPDVQVINIPGTWESSLQDPPLAPVQFPNALLHNVVGTLAQQYGPSRVEVFTTPYTAQFHNPLAADNQMSYDASREQGMRATLKAITDMNTRCPLTSYVLIGFSQGAVIAGDIASSVGNGRGPVDDDLVLGVTLIADGRRQVNVGKGIGPNPPGEGAEITLHDIPMLAGMGLTMTGAREDGLGSLNDKTNEICAPGDLICAAPKEAFSIANLPNTLNTLAGNGAQPIHALYATPQFWNLDGVPATDWTMNWARGVIENAPHPRHG
jgi:Cutinase